MDDHIYREIVEWVRSTSSIWLACMSKRVYRIESPTQPRLISYSFLGALAFLFVW